MCEMQNEAGCHAPSDDAAEDEDDNFDTTFPAIAPEAISHAGDNSDTSFPAIGFEDFSHNGKNGGEDEEGGEDSDFGLDF
jgi:hypothetical protein